MTNKKVLNGLRVVEKHLRCTDGGFRCRRGGDRLYEPVGSAGDAEAQHCGVRLERGYLQRPRAEHGGNQSGVRGRRRR